MGIEDFLPCDNEKINELLRFTAEVDKMTGIMRRTACGANVYCS